MYAALAKFSQIHHGDAAADESHCALHEVSVSLR